MIERDLGKTDVDRACVQVGGGEGKREGQRECVREKQAKQTCRACPKQHAGDLQNRAREWPLIRRVAPRRNCKVSVHVDTYAHLCIYAYIYICTYIHVYI